MDDRGEFKSMIRIGKVRHILYLFDDDASSAAAVARVLRCLTPGWGDPSSLAIFLSILCFNFLILIHNVIFLSVISACHQARDNSKCYCFLLIG